MEAVIKINITDWQEENWLFDGYDKVKLKNLTDDSITVLIADIIHEAIEENRVYYDFDDAEKAMQEILPAISSLILNPRFLHIKTDYDLLVEMVTYLTVRLA